VNDTAEIYGRLVRVLSLTEGMGSLSALYVFCSLQTARALSEVGPDQTTYPLAGCRKQADLPGSWLAWTLPVNDRPIVRRSSSPCHIDWRFPTADARIKIKQLYSAVQT
jgi:hypothetical protein